VRSRFLVLEPSLANHTRTGIHPAPIRRQLHIEPDTTLEWIVEGNTVRVIPLPADPLAAFRGSGKRKGGTQKELLKDRRRDRARNA
jgi:bifunctional DNA-binding transcriptional regulator/antitoxin component of YhaV-PrlF toxin-antitoxin module